MPDDLDEQIEAYEALLPQIKKEHGSVWALIAERRLVKTFAAFGDAARYAHENFGKRPVLIRHTDSRKVETVPYLHAAREA
jgi:hypothetical protein